MEQLKLDYRGADISAKDIILPPFKEGLSSQQIEVQRNTFITQNEIVEETKLAAS